MGEMQGVRRHPRYRLNLSCDVIGDEVLLYQPIVDLSMGGMRTELGGSSRVGDTVGVVLNFEGGEELALQGEVVWTRLDFAGVRWRFPNASTRLRLSSYLERLSPPPINETPN